MVSLSNEVLFCSSDIPYIIIFVQTIGLFVQSRLGAFSDKLNKRIPFVVGLSSTALVGISTLILSGFLLNDVSYKQSIDDENEEVDGSPYNTIAIILAFFGFGVADICFDCLLIPGRALLDDISAPSRHASEANSLFTCFQLTGRLLALLVASSSWTTSGFWGVYTTDPHFNACFTVSAMYLLASMISVVIFVDDRGAKYDNISTTNSISEKAIQTVDSDDELQMKIVHSTSPDHNLDNLLDDDNVSPISSFQPNASVLLFVVQSFGWVGVCSLSFFWTSLRGEEVGCVDLALQGVVGIVTTGLLPFANSYFGAAAVWFASELFFHVLMMLCITSIIPLRIICGLTGINYAVHATNALIVAAEVASDATANRARTIAMVNSALPMGQLVTALIGGVLSQYFGGFGHVFVCFGAADFLVTSSVWAYSSKHSLYSRVSE